MGKPLGIGLKINELSDLGYSYNQIKNELKCSKGTIAYHLGKGQKEKSKNRHKKLHPYLVKINAYLTDKKSIFKPHKNAKSNNKLLLGKISNFHQTKQGDYTMAIDHKFTVSDVINKFGDNPKCALTGELINVNKPRTYHFDHIIPRSRGGENTLDNLQLLTKQANQAKGDMTPDEFYNFCKKILENKGYKVIK